MKPNKMRKQYLPILLIFLLALGCSPCMQLQQKDEKISQQFENLKAKGLSTNDARYRIKLNALYSKEQQLLETVRTCDLEDPTVYNYWYGERLKYASDLEKAWYELQRSNQTRKRVSDLD